MVLPPGILFLAHVVACTVVAPVTRSIVPIREDVPSGVEPPLKSTVVSSSRTMFAIRADPVDVTKPLTVYYPPFADTLHIVRPGSGSHRSIARQDDDCGSAGSSRVMPGDNHESQ
jgi:hypothetical protein